MWDTAEALAVDDSGNVYVTGRSSGDGTSYDYATIKYSQQTLVEKVAQITVNPDPIAFGDVLISEADSITVSIGNTGDADLNVTKITSDLGAILEISENSFTVAPDAAHEIALTLTATTEGEINGILTIASNDPNSPTEIAISANVLICLKGDVDFDGDIGETDALLTLKIVVGLISPTPEQVCAADVNSNGKVRAVDALLILQYTVGLITQFPNQEAPIFTAKDEKQLLTKIIGELESSSLSTEQKLVLEQFKRLLWQHVLPKQTALLQNYPNPFNPETWLPYQLAQNAPVTICIYNTKGRLIRTLHLGNQKAGIYVTQDKAAYWDGKDSLGQKVASGVYYYTLKAVNFITTRKMVIIK
jgi:hypothetical protein